MPATGVLSSWLALATKSRRTRSSRARSVTSETTRERPPLSERDDQQPVGRAARVGVELVGARLCPFEAVGDHRGDGFRQTGVAMSSVRQPPAGSGTAARGAVGVLDRAPSRRNTASVSPSSACEAYAALLRARRCARASARARVARESARTCRSPGTSGSATDRLPAAMRPATSESSATGREAAALAHAAMTTAITSAAASSARPMPRDRAATASISVNGCDTRSATGFAADRRRDRDVELLDALRAETRLSVPTVPRARPRPRVGRAWFSIARGVGLQSRRAPCRPRRRW